MRTPETVYVPALTGLRGVAAWWVVLYHFSEPLWGVVPEWIYDFVKQGYLAVDLFFILSGFVIYLTSSASLQSLKWGGVSRFWINRLVRIYPLHLILMFSYLLNPLALWLFSESGGGEGRYDWAYYFASVFLIQNWGFFDDLQWNIPAWSISTELAAYLVAPVLMGVALVRLKKNQVWIFLGGLFGAIGLVLLFGLGGKTTIGEAIPTLGVARCVLEFWMGLCLGAICSMRGSTASQGDALRSVLIFLLFILTFWLMAEGIPNYWYAPAAFAALIYLLVKGDVVFSRFLSSSVVHYLGVISYSTYLVHYFVKDWVKFLSDSIGMFQLAVYVIVCGAASVVLYRWVEVPSRGYLKRRLLGVSS